MKKVFLGEKGLTFIELLAVVCIICVLWIIMINVFSGKTEKARKAVCKANIRIIQGQLEIYELKEHHYPKDQKEFDEFLKSIDYFARPSICPYDTPYIYDPNTHRVKEHKH